MAYALDDLDATMATPPAAEGYDLNALDAAMVQPAAVSTRAQRLATAPSETQALLSTLAAQHSTPLAPLPESLGERLGRYAGSAQNGLYSAAARLAGTGGDLVNSPAALGHVANQEFDSARFQAQPDTSQFDQYDPNAPMALDHTLPALRPPVFDPTLVPNQLSELAQQQHSIDPQSQLGSVLSNAAGSSMIDLPAFMAMGGLGEMAGLTGVPLQALTFGGGSAATAPPGIENRLKAAATGLGMMPFARGASLLPSLPERQLGNAAAMALPALAENPNNPGAALPTAITGLAMPLHYDAQAGLAPPPELPPLQRGDVAGLGQGLPVLAPLLSPERLSTGLNTPPEAGGELPDLLQMIRTLQKGNTDNGEVNQGQARGQADAELAPAGEVRQADEGKIGPEGLLAPEVPAQESVLPNQQTPAAAPGAEPTLPPETTTADLDAMMQTGAPTALEGPRRQATDVAPSTMPLETPQSAQEPPQQAEAAQSPLPPEVTYNGPQMMPGRNGQPERKLFDLYTDRQTGSTFAVRPGEDIAGKLAETRAKFEQTPQHAEATLSKINAPDTPSSNEPWKMTRAAFETTGEDLMHGTNRRFDRFSSAGTKNRYDRQNSDRFYFTEDADVAHQMANSGGYKQVAFDNWAGDREFDSTQDGLSQLRIELNAAVSKGKQLGYVDPETGELVKAKRAEDISDDDLMDGDVRLYQKDRWPRVVKAKVYGKTLDLTDPKKVPIDLAERLRKEGAYDPSQEMPNFQHEFSKELLKYARENGYGKIKVRDSYESGFRSTIGLEDYIGLGRDVHREAVQKALAEGKPVPPEVLADYPDLAAQSKPPIPPKGTPDEIQQIQQSPQSSPQGTQEQGSGPPRGPAGSPEDGLQGQQGEVAPPQKPAWQMTFDEWKAQKQAAGKPATRKLYQQAVANSRRASRDPNIVKQEQARWDREQRALAEEDRLGMEKQQAVDGWPGTKVIADKVAQQLADAGIQATRHEADSGSVYFDLPSGEKIRIADHAAPRGGGFNVEQQQRMGDAKYDLNAEGIREGMRGPVKLASHDEQIAEAIRNESPAHEPSGAPGELPRGKGEAVEPPLPPEPPNTRTVVAEEEQPAPVSLRKGDIDADRQRLGLDRIDGLEKKKLVEANAKAKAQGIASKAHELAQDVLDNNRRLTMEEVAGMGHRIGEINNRRRLLQDRIDNLTTDDAQRTFDLGEIEKGQQEADSIWQAVRQSGRASGQENAIKAAAWDSEGNLTEQLAAAREAKGSPLTAAERQFFERTIAERDSVIAKHEAELERLNNQRAADVLQRRARSKVTRSGKSYDESLTKVRDLLRAGCGRAL